MDTCFLSTVVTEPLESLGDSISTAVLLSWSKQPGDAVAEDDVIAIVETDKVTMDIRAKKSGKFVEGLVAAAGEIAVGAPLYKIDTAAKGAAAPKAAEKAPKEAAPAKEAAKETKAAAPAAKSAPVTVPVPIMGESITTGLISGWSVKVGDVVAADQVVAVIETDKVRFLSIVLFFKCPLLLCHLKTHWLCFSVFLSSLAPHYLHRSPWRCAPPPPARSPRSTLRRAPK